MVCTLDHLLKNINSAMADEEKYIDAYGIELMKGFSEWKTGNPDIR